MPAISFQPILMERVWGGDMLRKLYQRNFPNPNSPYGESWDVVDRADEQSIVAQGEHVGKTLHELWVHHRQEIFGDDLPSAERFPLLIKILDARDDLSIQVHPPAAIAPSLHGEPKTEMWYLAHVDDGAKLYVGLKNGSTKESFKNAIAQGTVADEVHEISVHEGESIFIPSGRLHAIGAGLVIFEIQQNSDTTYRVFDWNRMGLDGKPRALHVQESLASINFSDVEPSMDAPVGNVIAACEHFVVEKFLLSKNDEIGNKNDSRFSLLHIVSGSLLDEEMTWHAGSSLLLPKNHMPLAASESCVILRTTIP